MENLKILAVDDEPQALEHLKFVLTHYALEELGEKYNIITYVDSIKASKSICQEKFDFIFLDIYMPNLDGIELCRKVRDSYYNKEAIIYAFTNEQAENVQKLFLEAGFNDLIYKSKFTSLIPKMKSDLRMVKKLFKKEKKYLDEINLELDFYINGNKLGLLKAEYQILKVLAENIGKSLTLDKIQILRKKSYIKPEASSTIRVHLKNIRDKLREFVPETDFIVYIPNEGYILKNVEVVLPEIYYQPFR